MHFAEVVVNEGVAEGLPRESLMKVAEEDKAKVIETCEDEKPLKTKIDCLLQVDSIDGFEYCD